jgi:hypothetical protein
MTKKTKKTKILLDDDLELTVRRRYVMPPEPPMYDVHKISVSVQGAVADGIEAADSRNLIGAVHNPQMTQDMITKCVMDALRFHVRMQ